MNRIESSCTTGPIGRSCLRLATIVIAVVPLVSASFAWAQAAGPPAGDVGENQTDLRYFMSNGDSGIYVQPARKGDPFIVTYAPAAAGAGAPTFNVEYLDVMPGHSQAGFLSRSIRSSSGLTRMQSKYFEFRFMGH